jgi:hypothetical protein
MPELFNLSLGGILISLIPDQSAGDYGLVKRASEFCSPATPVIKLQIHCGWFPELDEQKIAFETNHAWQMFQIGNKRVIKVISPEQDPYQLGVFPPDFRSGDIYIAALGDQKGYVFPLSFPMGELFMINLLGGGLGMLFHAAGVIYQGEGYLFTGHGGAGKTTTARLWEALTGARVVNDDKVIVRKEAGQFRLYGTPWHGEGGMVLPDSAPLKRVFILKQAAQNYAASISPVQAAGSLLARTFVPLWDADKINYSLTFLDELCQAVPCLELGFLPDSSAVDFVRNMH